MVARWRKEPNEKGLARTCQGPRGLELREGAKVIIYVAPNTSGRWDILGWYWYGMGKNTYSDGVTFPTVEEAKADAGSYYKAHKPEVRP